jgi:preprotein translocase subunit YajC
MESIILFAILIAVFYFLIIRPQQKRAKTHKEFVASLKRGDLVITSSGIYGRIVEVEDAAVQVEIAKNTQIKVLKSYVAARQQQDATKDVEAVRDAG